MKYVTTKEESQNYQILNFSVEEEKTNKSEYIWTPHCFCLLRVNHTTLRASKGSPGQALLAMPVYLEMLFLTHDLAHENSKWFV